VRAHNDTIDKEDLVLSKSNNQQYDTNKPQHIHDYGFEYETRSYEKSIPSNWRDKETRQEKEENRIEWVFIEIQNTEQTATATEPRAIFQHETPI
jgi:hypothetical protein